jgi:hypothetical protein
MKFASLLLSAVALLFIQGAASAQTLSGAASSVRSSLNDLFETVDKKVDREEGRERIKGVIQQARAELARVQTLAEAGAPRSVVGGSKDRARDLTVAALGLVRGHRSEAVRHFAGNVRERLGWLDSAWESYGYGRRSGGYDSRGSDRDRDDRRGGTVYVPVPVRRY